MKPSPPITDSYATKGAILLLTVTTLVAFLGTLRNDFVAWDDDHLLLRNERFREIDADSLHWMFTTTLGGHYQPLTWLSYAVETQFLWGVNAAGFHFTNLLLHLATVLGFFAVAARLVSAVSEPCSSPRPTPQTSSRLVGATIAALLFAVHPLRVESVAWATERRDVLSAALLVWSVVCYLGAQSPNRRKTCWLTTSWGLYLLSLFSRAGGMTLPVVLFILDLYPLRRRLTRRLMLEKAVFLVPAIVFASTALWAQRQAGALRTFEEHSFPLRTAQACFGVMFYLVKTLWPSGLVPLYEQQPDASVTEPLFVICGLIAVLITTLTWMARRRRPALLATWIVYLVLLSPVLGFAQSGPQVVADRYIYLPSMALMTLVGGAIVRVWSVDRWRRIAVLGTIGPTVLLCIAATRAQVGIWKNTRTLWEVTLQRHPDTPLIRANYAVELNRTGEFAEARTQALLALQRLPGNRAAHAALAHAAFELGDLSTAEQHGRIALQIAEELGRPDLPTMIGRVAVLTLLDRPDEAEQLRLDAVQLDPTLAQRRFDPTKYRPEKDTQPTP